MKVKNSIVAAAMGFTIANMGCGSTLREPLRGFSSKEVAWCDCCGLQKIYTAYSPLDLFSVHNSPVEVVNERSNIVYYTKEFEIKNKDVFLNFLKNNYERLPKRLLKAEKIIVKGKVAKRADNAQPSTNPFISQEKFVSLGEENVVSLKYLTGKKWKKTSIPISSCLNQFFFGKELYEARAQLINDGVINPQADCKMHKK